MAAAVAPLVARKSLSDESRLTIHLPRADVGLRRGIGIAVALGASAAFEAIAIGTSYLWHAYSVATANMLTAVVGTGILVTLVVDFEPTKKTIAACIVGGVIFAAMITNITFMDSFFMRFHPTDGFMLWVCWNSIALSIATMVGTLLGLQAAFPTKNDV
jgi:hypothetical protein